MEVDKPGNFDGSINSIASDEDMFATSQDMFASSPEDGEVKTVVEVPHCSKTESAISEMGSSKEETSWRGTPFQKLCRNTGKDQFPPVVPGAQHSVLFKLPVREGEVPKPWPERSVDMWDQNHVRMPDSPSSLYPVSDTELRTRWELIQQALSTTITTSHQLEAAILHYNSMYSDRWDFRLLHSFFSEALEEMETEYFFIKVLPKIIELALSLPKLLTTGVPLLRQHVTHSVSLTQQQISCLLANAFLCTFPRRNTSKKDSEYSAFPTINFNRLFNGDGAERTGRTASLHEKLKCLINYFRRVTTKVPDGVVTYSRHYVQPTKLPEWSKETARLPNMYISSTGIIEDEGSGCLQVDFANKFVGGGVLGRGCVQEEIRFVICPELILARLFTEVLDDTEALIVTGCERFSTYQGYANTFEWSGNAEDSTPRDRFGRRCCTVVAIDAFRFPSDKTQYTVANINRELNKAYAGFSWGATSGSHEAVATGNWGCGAFRGDASLKSLLQLMAAARTGRDLAYFTFGDEELRDKVADMHSFLVARQVTVGNLWKVISSYNPTLYRHSLYDHIYQTITTGSIPLPKSMSPKNFKKPRVQEDKPKKQEMNNGYELSAKDIATVLEGLEDEEEIETAKPLEAKTLSLQNDKELCLKRLSSSWTNLNESKRDFGSSKSALMSSTSEPSGETCQTDKGRQSVSTSRQSEGPTRKKKISDYFQTVSKS